MGTNYNVRREEPDMEQLQHNYDECKAELDEALQEDGQYSRRYQNAEYLCRIAERKLDAAQNRTKQREESNSRTAKEIVDRVMER